MAKSNFFLIFGLFCASATEATKFSVWDYKQSEPKWSIQPEADLNTDPQQCKDPKLQTRLWPLPKQFTHGKYTIDISRDSFQFLFDKSVPTLKLAAERYLEQIFMFSSTKPKEKGLTSLKISVKNRSESHPQLNTDEKYSLNITLDMKATLTAETVYGALRGLETFSQLVNYNYNTMTYEIANVPWLIEDSPRFKHRGLMIDTSRHFLPLPHIREVIDSMVYVKLNVLHWHIVDDNSFPLQSYTHPKLWEGSFSPRERYVQADVAKIVEYGRLRGIRVMVEIDMPGHGASWCKGMPSMCPSATCLSPLNVAKDSTFQVVDDLLGELTGKQPRQGLFPDDFIHLGGDEVNLTCWDVVPEVSSWLKKQNYTADDGYKYFVDKVAKIALAQHRRPIQWVEVFEHFGSKLDKRTIIHIWKDKSSLQAAVKAGYEVLLSDYHELYLDYEDYHWEVFYNDDPLENVTDPNQEKLVLGGQCQMWGERVDPSDLQNTIWPRAAAFAERMWSPRSVDSTACALPRLLWFRCVMLERGVQAAPVTNARARENPPHPGTCFS